MHPAFFLAMAVTMVNNLWLKPSGLAPLLAGKLSDCAIMVFLPAWLCLIVVFWREQNRARLGKPEHPAPHRPSHATVVLAIATSAGVMTALQISDAASGVYDWVLRVANDVLFWGRVPAKARPDLTDLISLVFLAIPYRILTRSPGG